MKSEFYHEVFKPHDIGYWEVINRKKEILDNVVQLKVDNFVTLEMENHPFEECKHCRRIKYSSLITGYFPAFKKDNASLDKMNILKSSEWFGHGAQAFRILFISRNLFIKMHEQNSKDVRATPVKK